MALLGYPDARSLGWATQALNTGTFDHWGKPRFFVPHPRSRSGTWSCAMATTARCVEGALRADSISQAFPKRAFWEWFMMIAVL